jgi:hypothetical protein
VFVKIVDSWMVDGGWLMVDSKNMVGIRNYELRIMILEFVNY